MSDAIHNYASATLDPDIELVVFGWSNRHGHCYDCGLPAAFVIDNEGPRRPELLRCAVCAANAAAEGSAITRIEEIE